MIYDVITLFPEIIQDYCAKSITKRGLENSVIEVKTHNPRDYSLDKHRRVDDTPYGGGEGMVLACQPIFDCYFDIEKKENFQFIMLTPQGEKFNQKIAKELSRFEQIILLCGHYEGFDERIRLGLKPREISILIDSISRNLKNYLGKEASSHNDSFSQGMMGLLEYPHYTKPREYKGMKVPEVLLSGNHKEIEEFRKQQSLIRTQKKRPDLLNKLNELNKDNENFN